MKNEQLRNASCYRRWSSVNSTDPDTKPDKLMQIQYILQIKKKYLNLLKFSQRSTQLINRINDLFVL